METPPAEELLKKIQALEVDQAHLKQEMSKLKQSGDVRPEQTRQRSHSISPQRSRFPPAAWKKGSGPVRHSSPLQRESKSRESANSGGGAVRSGPSAVNFTDRQYLNILQSIGQSVYIFDLDARIIYW